MLTILGYIEVSSHHHFNGINFLIIILFYYQEMSQSTFCQSIYLLLESLEHSNEVFLIFLYNITD